MNLDKILNNKNLCYNNKIYVHYSSANAFINRIANEFR